MQAGTIEWNGLDLSRVGRPELVIRRVQDPPPPAQATREVCTLQVRVRIEALDPSRLQAALEHLQKSMRAAEGLLRSISPGGHVMSWNAIPASDNLAEALTGRTATVDLEFTAAEAFSTTGLVAASFTPDGGTAIPLHAIRDFRQTVATERHSPLADARRLTTVNVGFTARVMQAATHDTPAARMAALLTKAEELRALDCASGTLVHAGQSHVVRVQSLVPLVDEGRHALDLSLQCYYSVFPNDGEAECALNIETRDGEGEERIVSITGTVEAATQEIAEAKVTAIRTRHSTATRRLISSKTGIGKIDGFDTKLAGMAAEEWAGSLSFAIEFREIAADATRWTLKVTSRMEVRGGMRYSYTGTVRASTAEIALTKARALGGAAAHPFRVSAEEVVDTSNVTGGDASQFVAVAFSYEYEGPAAGFLFAEIGSDRNQSLFSERRTTVSGYVTAPDSAQARAFLATLMTGYAARQAVEETERESELALKLGAATTTRQAVRLDFSRSYPDTHTRAAAKYVEEVAVDDASMTTTTSVSGTVWTNTRANAETALNAVLASIFGGTAGSPNRPSTLRKSHPQESWGPEANFTGLPATRWIQLDFSASKTTKTAGEPGFDIIEARFTATRTGAINRAKIHSIPGGRPVAQTGVSYSAGTFTISATCKSRTQDAGLAWCQALRDKAPGGSGGQRHEISDPQESVSPEFEPFSGTSVTLYVTTASYSFGYSGSVAAMDGVWPAGLNMG